MFADDQVQIALGTVGWDGDPSVDITANDVTTIKVTLFEGRHLYERPVPGQAAGRKLECRIALPFYQACGIPLVGTKVVVAIPGGFAQCAGASVILGRFDDDPSAVALAKAAETQAILDAVHTFAAANVSWTTVANVAASAATLKTALEAITTLATTKTKGT